MIRAFDKWLVPYLKRKAPQPTGEVHLMISVCDHFEPLHHSDKAGAIKRVGEWQRNFPEIVDQFQDDDGEAPRHTFFYPIEQYDPDIIDPVAQLCHATKSEVEIHLHHKNDTPEGVAAALEKGVSDLAGHNLLSTDEKGKLRYGFIHGDWALNHSHPQGIGCGVDREIPILRRTGCYADFTMPSAPSPTQARKVNAISYAPDLPGERALNEAEDSRVAPDGDRRDKEDRLLMINGPLALNWGSRKWGLVPRIENGDITGANPPTLERVDIARKLAISVAGQPNWLFLKFHTHGGIEPNFNMLLGEPMRKFHQALREQSDFRTHYVSAREMTNMVHAAEDGHQGNPGEYRDYIFKRR